jgi:small-conductance mechanosensitive channel
METEFSPHDALTSVLESLTAAFADFLPKALTGLGVFLVGFLLAKIAGRLIRTSFEKFKINDLLERLGLTATLQRLGLQDSPGNLLGKLVYYLILILFIQSAAMAVGLLAVADSITAFFAYLPNLVAAFLVLLIGLVVAQFASGAVTRSARDSGVEFAAILGRIVSGLIVFVVGLMAVTQLQIDTDVIRTVVVVLLAGCSLALALTFGLGSRDITRNLVAGYYARKLFVPGEQIEIQGLQGKLAGISPVHALIEVDGRLTTIPNSVFIEEAVRQ